MKRIFTSIMILLLCAAAPAMAQTAAVINGHITGLPDETEVQLFSYGHYGSTLGRKSVPMATTMANGGRFSFTIEVEEPRCFHLQTVGKVMQAMQLIVAPGETIELRGNQLGKAAIAGSAYTDRFMQIEESPFRGGTPKGMSQKDFMEQLIREHADTFFGPLLLYFYSGYGFDYEHMYALFGEKARNSWHGHALKELVDKRVAERQKRENPAFRDSLNMVKRSTPSYDKPDNVLDAIVSQYKGRVVFVDFWATWCAPCRRGMLTLKPVEPWMEQHNIVRVYLSAPSSDQSQWETMVVGIGGNHYFMTDEEWKAMGKRYGFSGIPYYRIYDEKGNCVFDHIGYPGNDKLKEEFLKALGQ